MHEIFKKPPCCMFHKLIEVKCDSCGLFSHVLKRMIMENLDLKKKALSHMNAVH